MDYASGPYIVTIPALHTNATFNVKINNDNVPESDEYFMLTINETLLPDCIIRGDPDKATVIIVDDDRKLLVKIYSVLSTIMS